MWIGNIIQYFIPVYGVKTTFISMDIPRFVI